MEPQAPTEPNPLRLALVEDDREIRELLTDYLERQGFEVFACNHGAQLDALLAQAMPDLIVLDLMMPGEDGLSICRRLSAEGRVPIIILSGKGDDLDRIIGLEVGADDYMVKPCNPRELVARIRAVLRRREVPAILGQAQGEPVQDVGGHADAPTPASAGASSPSAPAPSPSADALAPAVRYQFAGWLLDTDARTLTSPAGTLVSLSVGEFELLCAFVLHPRRLLTRDQLLDWTRGEAAAPVDRAIDVQLSRLRKKLGDSPRSPELIKTVRGGGYLFAVDVQRR